MVLSVFVCLRNSFANKTEIVYCSIAISLLQTIPDFSSQMLLLTLRYDNRITYSQQPGNSRSQDKMLGNYLNKTRALGWSHSSYVLIFDMATKGILLLGLLILVIFGLLFSSLIWHFNVIFVEKDLFSEMGFMKSSHPEKFQSRDSQLIGTLAVNESIVSLSRIVPFSIIH